MDKFHLYKSVIVSDHVDIEKYVKELLLQMSVEEEGEFVKIKEGMRHELDCKCLNMVFFYAENRFDEKVGELINNKVLKLLIEDTKLFKMFVRRLLRHLSIEKQTELKGGLLELNFEFLVSCLDLLIDSSKKLKYRELKDFAFKDNFLLKLDSKKDSLKNSIRGLKKMYKKQKV